MNIKRLSFSIREFGKLIQCAHVPVINPVLNNVEGSDVINPVVNDVEGSDDEAEKYKPLEKWQKLAKTRGGILRVPSAVRSAPPDRGKISFITCEHPVHGISSSDSHYYL